MSLLHWLQDPWFMRGAWQIDANVAVISLATCKQQNCKCLLLLWHTPQTGLHRCLRRPKQGCPWPAVLAQRAPDPSQLLPYRRGQFLTYIQDTITLKSTSWKTFVCILCLILWMKKLFYRSRSWFFFPPKTKSKYGRLRTEREEKLNANILDKRKVMLRMEEYKFSSLPLYSEHANDFYF